MERGSWTSPRMSSWSSGRATLVMGVTTAVTEASLSRRWSWGFSSLWHCWEQVASLELSLWWRFTGMQQVHWYLTLENAYVDTGPDGHRPSPQSHTWSGPITGTNGRADSAGADVGGARWDTCLCALFPVSTELLLAQSTDVYSMSMSSAYGVTTGWQYVRKISVYAGGVSNVDTIQTYVPPGRSYGNPLQTFVSQSTDILLWLASAYMHKSPVGGKFKKRNAHKH